MKPKIRPIANFTFWVMIGIMMAPFHSQAEKHFCRKATLAGQFYPASPATLKKEIAGYLAKASSTTDSNVKALIVPHAGYPYSGPVAAEAYKTVAGQKFDSVIVIGFFHRIPLAGIFVDTADSYETPLGKIPVDTVLANEIREQNSRLQEVVKSDFSENSLEVQLPFLQEVIPNLKIVPIYMGMQTPENAKILADAIAKSIEGKNVLVVASSDLSHYHPDAEARDMDKKLITLVETSSISALYQLDQDRQIEACGIGPITTVLYLAQKMSWENPMLIRYANSGDITGDYSGVVGYSAFKFLGAGSNDKISSELSATDKQKIVKYVRSALENHFDPKKLKPILDVTSPVLNEHRGVFVTLKENDELRGCIGQIIATQPVKENLHDMALAAAFEDPRFDPVTAQELGRIDIHVSILTIPQPVQSYKDIRLGMDGIVVKHGFRTGVFLPEVATETGWGQKEFFEHCAREKAGISERDFDKVQILTFQTDSFGD